jgi:hypothetical protein
MIAYRVGLEKRLRPAARRSAGSGSQMTRQDSAPPPLPARHPARRLGLIVLP